MSDDKVPSEGLVQQCAFRLIPVARWNDYHDWPSVSGLRWMVFNARHTGFDECVIRIGRRVLIDEEKFFVWVRSHGKEVK